MDMSHTLETAPLDFKVQGKIHMLHFHAKRFCLYASVFEILNLVVFFLMDRLFVFLQYGQKIWG